MERLHPTSTDNPSNSFRSGVYGSVDSGLYLGVPAFDDNAR